MNNEKIFNEPSRDFAMTLSTMNTHSSTYAGKSLRNIRTKVDPELQLFKSEM